VPADLIFIGGLPARALAALADERRRRRVGGDKGRAIVRTLRRERSLLISIRSYTARSNRERVAIPPVRVRVAPATSAAE